MLLRYKPKQQITLVFYGLRGTRAIIAACIAYKAAMKELGLVLNQQKSRTISYVRHLKFKISRVFLGLNILVDYVLRHKTEPPRAKSIAFDLGELMDLSDELAPGNWERHALLETSLMEQAVRLFDAIQNTFAATRFFESQVQQYRSNLATNTDNTDYSSRVFLNSDSTSQKQYDRAVSEFYLRLTLLIEALRLFQISLSKIYDKDFTVLGWHTLIRKKLKFLVEQAKNFFSNRK